MKTNKENCTVLIVDDDDDLCHILESMIRKLCPVHAEHDLRHAESFLALTEPAIIFLDNNLPDGLGIKYIRHFKELYPNVKIVLMTADTSSGIREKAMREGAERFVSKPFQRTVINDLILSICPELRAA